ncbi:MAG: cytochrome c [Gammaproteobacteria bacterium]|jgi:cytochrome c553|nr:cytochrome c [Gammaproteobacteria bacterium]MCW9059313.1 cytochrome c [Gammaproteobacteria bacterium]
MKIHILPRMVVLGLSLSLGGTALAAGDPVAGQAKATTCLGCHGVPGYTNAYPTYRVPKLGGQHAQYLVAAMQAYKSGQRGHDTMHAQISSLSEQDMEDIAAWFSGPRD